MKRVPLKVLASSEEPADRIDYASIIKQVIRRPLNAQTGADIEELRRGIRVLDALDKCDSDALVLEDSDWQHLADKTRAMPWGVVDRRVLEFVDDVLGAREVASASPDGVLQKA